MDRSEEAPANMQLIADTHGIISYLCREANATARDKGFYEESDAQLRTVLENSVGTEQYDALERTIKAQRVALIHSEVSELLEAIRKGDKVNEAEELSDILIRVFDYAAEYNISLSVALIEKMAENKNRPHKHGKAF